MSVLVGLASQSEHDLRAFEGRDAAWTEVRECHMVAGEMDFLLKIVSHSWDEYQKFLTTELTVAENVNHVKSALSIRTAKNQPGVPIDIEAED